MKYRATINESLKVGGVTVKADPLVVDIDEGDLSKHGAAALVAAIERDITRIPARTADGKRQLFNRTGRLSRSIEAQPNGDSYDIVAPPGYLEDPALLERLAEHVPALNDPFGDAITNAVIDRIADDIVKVGR